MDLEELKKLIEQNAKANTDYRKTNDERMKAIEGGDTTKARDLDEKLIRIEADVTKFGDAKAQIERIQRFEDEHKQRIEELESRIGQPGVTKVQKMNREHVGLFEKALRGQFQNPEVNQELKAHERALLEAKAVTIASGPGGGFAVPEELSRSIEKLERKISPVRDLVQVVPVGSSDFKKLISLGGAASGWVGESGARTETGTPLLREVAPTHGELYAYPQASEWSLDDAFFSIEQWLRDETAEEFAFQEGDAVIRGDGANKPTGMLNAATVTTTDEASPLRAAEAYQHIVSAGGVIDPDTLFDLIYSVNRRYRAGASFTFNSLTAGALRKLKDGQGQYHWQPGLALGEPSTLLGFGTVVWEDMDDVAVGDNPIGFGNFNRGYLLTDRVGMRITVDAITNPGFIRFYIRRREGGKPLNNNSIKFLQIAA